MRPTRLVYSTDPDWCSKCQHLPCICAAQKAAVKPKGTPHQAKIRLEKSGRGGKAVTVVFELGLPQEGLRELLKVLKGRCGTGGTLKEGSLEIQGDQRERIEQILAERGIKSKRAGG